MGKDKRDKMILALIIVIVLLLGVLVYLFLVGPAISGYVVKAQNQGVEYTILSIVQQIQEKGYAQISIGNQTLTLVPYQAPTSEQTTQ